MNTEIEDSVRTLNPNVPQEQPRTADRRGFLFKLAILINGAIGLLIATPVIRFLLGPVRPKKDYESWIALGKVSDYEPGSTILATYRNPYTNSWDGETAKVACYVRRQLDGTFTVFAVNCAHLGCPVRWFPQSGLFMCPCHGGAYYRDGSRASGPPERGLFEYPYKVQNGVVTIQAGGLPTTSETVDALVKKPTCA